MFSQISGRVRLAATVLGTALALAGPVSLAQAAPLDNEPLAAFTAAARTNTAAPAAWAAGTRAYLVITAPGDTTAVRTAVANNGGSVFASYDAIGVIVAHSTSASFAATMRGVSGVQKVGATRTSDVPADAYNPALPANPSQATAPTTEPVRSDMTQIKADQAWAVNPGSASVKVGILDTGVDDQHQDLAPNFNAADSVSCAYGKTDTRAGAWRDVDQHGTHVAGTVAAAKNGKGAIGVAPGVRISSVRIAEPGTTLFFAENTICGLVWAGDHGFKVTNNSYYTDPWQFNCPNDLDQAAILEGVGRAQAYADGKGSLQVAAAGNSNVDLANKTSDASSPNDSTPVNRTITNDCLDIPAELPGVVTVAANGTNGSSKASFSNYGRDVIEVSAPGESVYSTAPGGKYASLSGTSMASPHVAGVAALLASANPAYTPADIRAKLGQQATDLACPSDARCTGTTAKNSFFGEGRVDALKAVSGSTPPAGAYFENLTDVAIADNATVESSLTVSGVTGNAPATLKVGVDIKHTYIGDLKVDLVAPDGSVYTLHNRTGSGTDNIAQTYTVNASSEVANGVWKLRVNDNASQDTGKIDAWNLTF
ncbi:S8 family serine peptidase [Streptomyces sp. SP18ES09]|uniref:S8 family serine peptidase n=1 Tax=Streptomyces sp. SP18ES09 TaxID=3002532 RepID=UPI002E7A1DBA|nr:S8 family serine peptidase [Streptomyces sp. SP18ES09]MEE1816096.1 S8 family serine peptidase [Streptomyces sp. SP18ES09]